MKHWAFFSLLALASMGCDDSASGPVDGGLADSLTPDSGSDTGPCTTCSELEFEVELASLTGPINLEDGAVVEWQWGFQGGTMVAPRIVFAEGSVEVGQEVRVELTHAPDPDAPEAYGEVASFPGVTQDLLVAGDDEGRLVLALINDQLGWDELTGTRLVLSALVRTGEERGSRSGAISLAIAESPCDVFERSPGGCSYYQIPGSAVVSLGPSDGRCTGARRVGLTFSASPEVAEAAEACALAQTGTALRQDYTFTAAGDDPPVGCLEEHGLTEGATVQGVAEVILTGTCVPTSFRLDTEAASTSCSALCNP